MNALKVEQYLYEMSGRAGTVCQTGEILRSPEYNEAFRLFVTLSAQELEEKLRQVVHLSGGTINWYALCISDARERQRYLDSDEWKRKRETVLNRAKRVRHTKTDSHKRFVDKSGRFIESVECVWYSQCENGDCENEATQIHHKHYQTFGKEDVGETPELSDLQALCGKCHARFHNKEK